MLKKYCKCDGQLLNTVPARIWQQASGAQLNVCCGPIKMTGAPTGVRIGHLPDISPQYAVRELTCRGLRKYFVATRVQSLR
jgi:hypothetical protein